MGSVRSRSLGFGVIINLVASFAVSLPAKLRASRLDLQEEKFRLDGRKMNTCDWRQAMASPFKERLDNAKSGLEAHVCHFFPP